MLRNKYPYAGRDDLIFYYSDAGMMIKQIETGILYVDAVDTYPFEYHYTETDTPISGDTDQE